MNKNKLTKNLLILTIFLSLFLISLSSVNAAEHNITNSTTGGLNNTVANVANNGDTINLEEGVYTTNVTNIVINKNLTIVGENPETTIIDAQQLGRVFNITAGNTLTLINITLINGKTSYGGAIYNNGGSLTITNSIFKNNNVTSEGGAIYNNNSFNLKISDCIFDSNSANVAGGAISNVNVTNTTIFNCIFKNNIAPFGAAIATEKGKNTNITNSNFTNNTANNGVSFLRGSILDIQENNSLIQGCNIYNNSQGFTFSGGIVIESGSNNVTINYNRIFNNTGFDLSNFGTNSNADLNWWGNNTPTMIIGIIPNNHFVMNVGNLTSTVTNGSASFNYTFGLNTTDPFDPNLLPFFVTDVYTNVTSGIQQTFDARFNRTVTVDTDVSGQNVTYTFITDNEVQNISLFVEPTPTNLEVNNPSGKDGETVDLIARLTDQNGNPIAGKLITFHVGGMTLTAITDANGIATVQYTINADDFTDGQLTFTATFEGDDNYLASTDTGIITLIEEPPIPPEPPTPTPTPENETNETTNISAATAAMKKTGIPINLILLVLLSLIGFGYYRKQ